MLKAIVRHGLIVPLEPLPTDWNEGTCLEVAKAPSPAVDIDAWAHSMNELCADSSQADEETMRRAVDEQRRQAKDQARRDFLTSTVRTSCG